MFQKYAWLLCVLTKVVVDGGSPEIIRDSSFLRLMNRHYSGVHTPRTQWSQEDYHRYQSQGTSQGHAVHDSTLGATEISSEQAVSLQTYRRPSSANSNYTGVNHYSYSGAHLGSITVPDGSSYQEPKLGSYSMYRYPQTVLRPAASSHVAVKKTPVYYVKGNLQLQSFDASGKGKYKKPNLHQTASSYKKNTYPRVHKPYTKLKYPTRKTVYPFHRNYYQSPYQKYAIPSEEALHYKLRSPGDGYYAASAASPPPTSITQRRHTTERMDDAYPEGSSASEDYSTYGVTQRGSNYEGYEEVEKTTSEPEEAFYDENTTRGYYGDRIYMSTQVPVVSSSDRAAVKNKYLIVRRTSDDDEDIETIFE